MSLSNITSFATAIIKSNLLPPKDPADISSFCFGDDENESRTVGIIVTDPIRTTSATRLVPLFWMEESMNEKSVRFRTNPLFVLATRQLPISCTI